MYTTGNLYASRNKDELVTLWYGSRSHHRYLTSISDPDKIYFPNVVPYEEMIRIQVVPHIDIIEYADKYSKLIWDRLMKHFNDDEKYYIGCNDVSDIVFNAILDVFDGLKLPDDQVIASDEIMQNNAISEANNNG